MFFFITGALFFLAYASLIFYYLHGWRRLKSFEALADTPASIRVSVIVAARNEEATIGHLLSALQAQTYPSEYFEVIVVDDHSEDHTAEVVRKKGGNVRLLTLGAQVHSKKKAIEAGVIHSTGELIVTTDADCLPGKDWLHTLVQFYRNKNAVFIAAPVRYKHQQNLLEIFQTLDFITLQGITAASVSARFHAMCNGANLAYTKKAFTEVNGFEGIDKLASGDDLLLMHKIWTRYPEGVYYLKNKNAIVQTPAVATWKAFFWQRIRWASKSTYYTDKRIFWALLLLYLFNVFFIVMAIAGFWDEGYWKALLLLLLLKTMIEFSFVYTVAKFFQQQTLVRYFLFMQPLHILYTVVIGMLSQMGSYQWKGRHTK